MTIFSCQNRKFLENVLLNYVLNFLTTTFAYFCLQCSTMFTNLTNVTSFYSSNSSTDFKTIFNRCNVKKGLKNILFSYKVGFCIYCGDLAAIVDAILDPEKRSTPINQDFQYVINYTLLQRLQEKSSRLQFFPCQQLNSCIQHFS